MTDKYTLEEIEAATIKLSSNPSYDDVDEYMELLKAELTRPKPEFAEGQVLWFDYSDFSGTGIGSHYVVYEACDKDAAAARARNLTLTEHGPAVIALRDAMKKILKYAGKTRHVHDPVAAVARGGLAAFDAAIFPKRIKANLR